MYYTVRDKNKSRKDVIGTKYMKIISYLRRRESIRYNAIDADKALHAVVRDVIDNLDFNKAKYGLIHYIISNHFDIIPHQQLNEDRFSRIYELIKKDPT